MNETDQVVPGDLLYSTDHQWVRLEFRNGTTVARTGLTHYAQDTLGDVQFVALPTVGTTYTAAAPCGEAEASKAVTDLYAPVGGSIIAVNERLREEPSLVNSDPYGLGWLYELVVDTESTAGTESTVVPLGLGLMAADAYRELVP